MQCKNPNKQKKTYFSAITDYLLFKVLSIETDSLTFNQN